MNTENATLSITSLGGLKAGIDSVSGDGAGSVVPRVLFIHGFGSDKQSWVGNAPALFDIAEVQALDLPGHGDSLVVESPGDFQVVRDHLLRCLEAGNDGPTHLVAHSLGAAVAMLCAVTRPDLVASLTLIAPAGLGQGVSADFTRSFIDLDNEESALALLRTLVHNPRLIPPLLGRLLLNNLDRAGARAALQNVANGLHSCEELMQATINELKSVDIQCQIIWGLQDNINPPNMGDEAEFGGQWLWLEDCGHLPHVECRVVVNDAIRDFVKK